VAVKPLLGGVELGGTNCVCLIGTGPDERAGGIDGYAVAPDLRSLAGPLGLLAPAADTI